MGYQLSSLLTIYYKMQTLLIKGSILIAKAVHRLAEVETEIKDKAMDIGTVVDQCNDTLSLSY